MAINATLQILSVPPVVPIGVPFNAVFRVTNTGNEPIGNGNNVRIGSSSPRDTSRWTRTRIDLPSTIQPGASLDITAINLIPTGVVGPASFAWEMVQDGVAWFGSVASVTVQIMPESRTFSFRRPAGRKEGGQVYDSGRVPMGIHRANCINNTTGTILLRSLHLWLGADLGTLLDTQLHATLMEGTTTLALVMVLPCDRYANPATPVEARVQWPYDDPLEIDPGQYLEFTLFGDGSPSSAKIAGQAFATWRR